jgi:hypothetical protein
MSESVLVRARHGLGVRVVMTCLIFGLATFLFSMAVLVSHDSALECQPRAACAHVERYPLGVVNETPLAAIQRADVRWDTGGRAAALKLVLRHADGTSTEYQGVGKNGERAEDTALAINTWLAKRETGKIFALRQGSVPVAVFLALLSLVGLGLIPYFFSKLRVARSLAAMEITIERWPAPPRRHSLRQGEGARVTVRERVVNGQPFFSLWLERASAPGVELGLSFRTPERAIAEQETISQLLR